MKKLVLYYSFSGTTRHWAEAIAHTLGADLQEIVPAPPIEDRKAIDRLAQSKESLSFLPFEKDPEDYELIVIGTPVWAGTAAIPTRQFLKQHPIQGKQVALFATFRLFPAFALLSLRGLLKGNRILGQARFKQGKASPEQLTDWARSL